MLKPLPTPEFVKPSEVEEVHEQVTITEEVNQGRKTQEGEEKESNYAQRKRTAGIWSSNKLRNREKLQLQLLLKVLQKKSLKKRLKHYQAQNMPNRVRKKKFVKQVTVTQEVTERRETPKEDPPKRRSLSVKAKNNRWLNVVTIEEQGKRPTTTVTEGAVEEIVEEMVKTITCCKTCETYWSRRSSWTSNYHWRDN